MPWIDVLWDYKPGGNVEHIAEHGLTPEEVRPVLESPLRRGVSNSSGLPMVFGITPSGKVIAVVYEEIDRFTVYPITAYELED